DAGLGLSGGGQRGHGGRGGGNGCRAGRGGRGCGCRLHLRRGVGFHVLLGNPAAGARALHLRQIEIELARHLAHQRRERTGGLRRRRRRRCHLLGGRGRSLGGRLGLGRRRFGGGCGGSELGRRRFGGGSGGSGLGSRWVGRRKRLPHLIDARDYGVDADRLAFLHQDLGEGAGGRRRNFGIHLVGGDLKQRLVALDALAGLFEPFGQRAFHNAFAHLGHDDVGHISSPASRNRKSGRSERRVWRPPRGGLHGRRARPSRSRAWSIRRERCTENSSGRWTR